MSKSLKLLFANSLEDNGYKMSTVNHYEKKYKNFLFCVDKDIADHLLLRLLIKNKFKKSKCVKNEFINSLSQKSKDELIKIVLAQEELYLSSINNYPKLK